MIIIHQMRNSKKTPGISRIGVSLGTHIQKIKRKKISLIFLMLTGLILLSGCYEAIQGSTVKLKRSNDFYLGSAYTDRYVIIRPENYQSILADAQWVLADGLTLVENDLSLYPIEVSWYESNTKYTVQGTKLTVKVAVFVAEDAEPGLRSIQLKLPGLLRFGTSTNSSPVFKNSFYPVSDDYWITIGYVNIHETAAARNLAILKNFTLWLIIGVVVIGVVVLVLYMYARQKKS